MKYASCVDSFLVSICQSMVGQNSDQRHKVALMMNTRGKPRNNLHCGGQFFSIFHFRWQKVNGKGPVLVTALIHELGS